MAAPELTARERKRRKNIADRLRRLRIDLDERGFVRILLAERVAALAQAIEKGQWDEHAWTEAAPGCVKGSLKRLADGAAGVRFSERATSLAAGLVNLRPRGGASKSLRSMRSTLDVRNVFANEAQKILEHELKGKYLRVASVAGATLMLVAHDETRVCVEVTSITATGRKLWSPQQEGAPCES